MHWIDKYNLLIFNTIDSTNSEAMRLIKANANMEYVILSEMQLRGRGRYQNEWQSPKGNLYFSLMLTRFVPINIKPQFSFITSVAVYQSIKNIIERYDYNAHSLKIKWPNDLILNDKKVSGILLESININSKCYTVIGIGVNILSAPINIHTATSIKEYINQEIDIYLLLDLIMNNFDTYFNIWEKKGFKEIRNILIDNAFNLNQNINFNDGNQLVSGIFKNIDEQGNLVLKLSDGSNAIFSAGEILL